MRSQPTLWITGASGFVGQQALRLAPEVLPGWRIRGLGGARQPALPGLATCEALDLTDARAVERTFRAAPPAAILHLAAAADPNWCQTNPEAARAINVEAPRRLAALCREAGTILVFSSTDLVFDGREPPYAEDRRPAPLGIYSAQKWEAEQVLREAWPRGTRICRLPLMFGEPSAAGRNLLAPVVQALESGIPTPLFVDEFRTPISTVAAAEGLLLAVRLPVAPPLLHLGGRERVSRYELGCRLAAWLGCDPTPLQGKQQREVAMAAPRPPDVSLDSALAFSLGFRPLPLEQEWERLAFFREARRRRGR